MTGFAVIPRLATAPLPRHGETAPPPPTTPGRPENRQPTLRLSEDLDTSHSSQIAPLHQTWAGSATQESQRSPADGINPASQLQAATITLTSDSLCVGAGEARDVDAVAATAFAQSISTGPGSRVPRSVRQARQCVITGLASASTPYRKWLTRRAGPPPTPSRPIGQCVKSCNCRPASPTKTALGSSLGHSRTPGHR